MAQIGTLAASGVTVLNIQFLPEFLVVGDIGNEINYEFESIISGKSRQVSTDGLLNSALNAVQNAGVKSETTGEPIVGRVQPVADGGKGDVTVQLRFTNPTAQSVPIFGASTGKNNGTCKSRSTSQVDGNSNQEYKFFDKIAFRKANVQSVQIEWVNGWSDRFTVQELDAILSKMTPFMGSDNGILDTVTVLDNTAEIFKSVRIYSTGLPVIVLREGTELI